MYFWRGLSCDKLRAMSYRSTLSIVVLIVVVCSLTLSSQTRSVAPRTDFNVVEAGIPEIQAALKSGRLTSRQLVIQYLTRIGLYEHRLNAALAINPNAIVEADTL